MALDNSDAVPGYQIYLLRAWQETGIDPTPHTTWRFSLENTFTKQRRGFKSLEEMTAFLAIALALPPLTEKD